MIEQTNRSSAPNVSIGMFVYNGDSCIQDAIESILNQSVKEFELIISDNASTDKTEEICRKYASQDNRIRYIRQLENIGATANCLVVLDQAVGEYFMWAAHDDIKSDDFVEINLKFLQENLDYIASTSPICFKGGSPDPAMMGDKSLNQERANERFMDCLSTWRGCGRFYSLMRRSVLLDSKVIRHEPYMGLDIAFILELAIKGKFNRAEQGYVALGRSGVSGSGNIYKAYRTSLSSLVLPLSEFSLEIWRLSALFSLRCRISVAGAIFKMNLISFLHQIKTELKLLSLGKT